MVAACCKVSKGPLPHNLPCGSLRVAVSYTQVDLWGIRRFFRRHCQQRQGTDGADQAHDNTDDGNQANVPMS